MSLRLSALYKDKIVQNRNTNWAICQWKFQQSLNKLVRNLITTWEYLKFIGYLFLNVFILLLKVYYQNIFDILAIISFNIMVISFEFLLQKTKEILEKLEFVDL